MNDSTSPSLPSKTIGIDLGDRVSVVSIRNDSGEVVEQLSISTMKDAFRELIAQHPGARLVYEVGTHSPWITWLARDMGIEPIVANPGRVKLIANSMTKCDRKDADMLSDLGFFRPSLLSPITHRGPEGSGARAVIAARATLVKLRTILINSVRGLMKSIGERVVACGTDTFHKKLWIPESLHDALSPLRDQIASLTEKIRSYDRRIEQLSDELYPETNKLRQVRGVGPITALSFVLHVDDPSRFARSREVGSYFGLAPKVRQSGDQNPELRITKAGDRVTRSLLVQCAHYIMGPFGEDCDLQRFGQRLAERGGRNAKRRAIVAVARKLAVLLHRLWVGDEPYEPLRQHPVALAS